MFGNAVDHRKCAKPCQLTGRVTEHELFNVPMAKCDVRFTQLSMSAITTYHATCCLERSRHPDPVRRSRPRMPRLSQLAADGVSVHRQLTTALNRCYQYARSARIQPRLRFVTEAQLLTTLPCRKLDRDCSFLSKIESEGALTSLRRRHPLSRPYTASLSTDAENFKFVSANSVCLRPCRSSSWPQAERSPSRIRTPRFWYTISMTLPTLPGSCTPATLSCYTPSSLLDSWKTKSLRQRRT